jgi:hypothetical protein
MKRLAIGIILLLFALNNLVSQDIFTETENAFGPDPLLFNGKKYTYFVPSSTEGNQFFKDEQFLPGMVTIKGITFEVEDLNYDIYNQEILLRYPNESGALSLIALSQSWIERFNLGDKRFEFATLPGNSKMIYQVIRTQNLGILFFWSKRLKLDMAYGSDKYVFSTPVRESYVQIGGKFFEFKNNKTFVKAFMDEMEDDIRKFLKSNHINIKKVGDNSLQELLNYCEALLK